MKRVETNRDQLLLLELLKAAKSDSSQVQIVVVGKNGNRHITGVVSGLDFRLHLVKVETKDDWHLIDLVDVVEVSI